MQIVQPFLCFIGSENSVLFEIKTKKLENYGIKSGLKKMLKIHKKNCTKNEKAPIQKVNSMV